jgi:Short C-terminal domain/Domain of unknown function (DUF4429)
VTDSVELFSGTLLWDGREVILHFKDTQPGDQGAWSTMCRTLRTVTVPVTALSSVSISPVTRREYGYLILVPRRDASPFHSVAAEHLTTGLDPLGIAFDDEHELLVEYYAQEIQAEISQHGLADVPARKPLIAVPASLPHAVGIDGILSLHEDHVEFTWGINTRPAKLNHGRHWRIPLSAIETATWRPANATPDGHGYLQLRLAGVPESVDIHPLDDPNAIVLASEDLHALALIFGAALLVHISEVETRIDHDLVARWLQSAQPSRSEQPPKDSTRIVDQIKQLGELRATGILTEEEFQSKKQQLLDRI